MTIERYLIDVPDAVLADLDDRLARTRWPADLKNEDWRYGTPRSYLEELVEYWRTEYDWRAHERKMNCFPNFLTTVDDIPIHFIYERGKGPSPIPLVITHGWPDTFWDFEKIIRPLTDPASFGGDPADAFDVIVPSLPGHGFSMPLPVTGLNFERTADLWIKFMNQLGYDRFAAGGMSWGQLIAAQLGHKYPDRMIGLHMCGTLPLTMMSGFPAASEYAPDELDRLAQMNKSLLHGSSHAAVHTVEPQNLSYAMHDSPAALLAWLVNRRYWWGDHGGRIEESFSKDDLITNAMLYWVNESFVNTVRFYWEGANRPWQPSHANVPQVATPTAIAIPPADIVYMPKKWMETFYNLKQLTFMESGGHFAPMEEPEAIVADIQKFFRGLRSRSRSR